MQPRDQRHCFDVYRSLRRQGGSDREVLQAALLHDAGKGRLAASADRWEAFARQFLPRGRSST